MDSSEVASTPAIPYMRLHPTDLTSDDLYARYPDAQSPQNIHNNERGDPLIQIAFWGPDNTNLLAHNSDSNNAVLPFVEESGCFFSLAACWTRGRRIEGDGLIPSFTHCEMRFANGYVCSIHEFILVPRAHSPERVPGYVHCRIRELDRKDYFFVEMPVSREQHEAMFRKACRYAHDRVPFNSVGMYLNFVFPFSWSPVEKNGTAFFCSELIAHLLTNEAKLPLLLKLHPSTTSPNALWQCLSKLDDAFVSYNRNSSARLVLDTLVVPPPARGGGRQLFTIPKSLK
jgi:hypothetical protein